jgi:hypothetical protein
MRDEVFQRLPGLLRGHGPVKVVEFSRMTGEALVYEGEHLPGHGVRGEAPGRGVTRRPSLAKALPVFAVEVPRAAYWFALLHQDGIALAHFPIEKLHPKLLPTLRMGCKLRVATQKMTVLTDFQRDARRRRRFPKLLVHAPLAGFDNDPTLRTQVR